LAISECCGSSPAKKNKKVLQPAYFFKNGTLARVARLRLTSCGFANKIFPIEVASSPAWSAASCKAATQPHLLRRVRSRSHGGEILTDRSRHSIQPVIRPVDVAQERESSPANAKEDKTMSLGLILVIILVIFLFGGFSGRFGGYGYGYGHGGVGIIGTILIIVVVLMLLGRI
jgi:hypothetical protein